MDMRLQKLTGLERIQIEEEYAELLKKIAYLESVLADESLLLKLLKMSLPRSRISTPTPGVPRFQMQKMKLT